MPGQYQAIEARIQTACAAVRIAKKPNIAALAREYSVPRQRLAAH